MALDSIVTIASDRQNETVSESNEPHCSAIGTRSHRTKCSRDRRVLEPWIGSDTASGDDYLDRRVFGGALPSNVAVAGWHRSSVRVLAFECHAKTRRPFPSGTVQNSARI